MTEYLSEAWLADPRDAAAEALAAAGGTLRVGRIVKGAPGGEARYTAEVADGGVRYRPGVDEDDVDVTLTDTYANAAAMLAGELDPNAAFMSGRTKVSGHTGRLLELLAAAKGDRYQQLRAEVAATCSG